MNIKDIRGYSGLPHKNRKLVFQSLKLKFSGSFIKKHNGLND